MNNYKKITDFHGERQRGVGSSDIPVLAGLTIKYGSTPLKLWQVKTGRAEPWAGNERTWWGHQLEGLILARWVRDHYSQDLAHHYLLAKLRGEDCDFLKSNTECRHPQYQWALAHADLMVDPVDNTDPCIVEAKSAGFFSALRRDDDPDSGYSREDRSENGIPAAVYLQVQWQMFVYGVDRAYVCALIDTGDYREYGPIHANKKVQEQCLALAERFWRCVEEDIPPEPKTWEDVQILFPEQRDTTAIVSGEREAEVRQMLYEYHRAKEAIKQYSKKVDDIKNALGLLLGENSILSAPDGEILAKSYGKSRENIQLSKIKKEAPELYEQLKPFMRVTSWREIRL